MGLIMNIFRDSVIPFTQFGGVTMSPEISNFNKQELWINIYAGEGGIDDMTSIPRANRHPVAWRLPMKGGLIVSRNKIEGLGNLTAGGVNGYGIQCTMSGSGTISTANAGLLAGLTASLAGSGSLSGNIIGGIFAACELSGYGVISQANLTDGITRINLTAQLDGVGTLTASAKIGRGLAATLSGSSTLEAAFSAIAHMTSELIGNGIISGALPLGIGHMTAEVTPFTTLSPENLASKVWNAIALDYNVSGTMGNKLNLASSGGIDYQALADAVWESLTLTYDDPLTIGGVISILDTKLDELHKIQGLDIDNPMTVTPDSRIAGSIELEITGDGETTTTVTRQ